MVEEVKTRRDNTLYMIAFVLMILTCVSVGWLLIPLAWLIPMTLKINRAMKDPSEEVSTAFKVCVLIFGDIISGILLLVGDKDF